MTVSRLHVQESRWRRFDAPFVAAPACSVPLRSTCISREEGTNNDNGGKYDLIDINESILPHVSQFESFLRCLLYTCTFGLAPITSFCTLMRWKISVPQKYSDTFDIVSRSLQIDLHSQKENVLWLEEVLPSFSSDLFIIRPSP